MSTINPIGGAQVGGPLGGTQQVASGALEALSSAFLQILGGGGGAASGTSPSAGIPAAPASTSGSTSIFPSGAHYFPTFDPSDPTSPTSTERAIESTMNAVDRELSKLAEGEPRTINHTTPTIGNQ